MKKYKILYHHRIASKDGQYVHLEEMVNAFKDAGHELVLVGPTIVETDEFGSGGGFVALLKRFIPGFLYELLEFCYSFYSFLKLRKAIKQHKPDFIYERYNLYMVAGIWAKKIYGLPLLLEVNAPLYEERKKYNGISLPRFAKWTERYTWCSADKVLPVTQVLADMVIAEGVAAENIEVIHNGINQRAISSALSYPQARENLNLAGHFVIGFVGFIRDWHGLDRVIDLLVDEKLRDCYLVVVGDGPVCDQLKQQAKQLGISDRVIFTGIVQRDEILNYVAAFDVALQPAVVKYASPLKLFEYLGMGKAIIAPDCDNIKEIVEKNVSALLIPENDREALSSAICRLHDDEALRKQLTNGALATIENKQFIWKCNVQRVVALVEG